MHPCTACAFVLCWCLCVPKCECLTQCVCVWRRERSSSVWCSPDITAAKWQFTQCHAASPLAPQNLMLRQCATWQCAIVCVLQYVLWSCIFHWGSLKHFYCVKMQFNIEVGFLVTLVTLSFAEHLQNNWSRLQSLSHCYPLQCILVALWLRLVSAEG